MKGKAIRNTLLLLCVLAVCSGCEKKTENEEPVLVSVEHLLDHREEALQEEYENIRLAEGISVAAPEQVSVLECRLREDVYTKENFAFLCENFFTDYPSQKIRQESDGNEGSRFEITFGKEGEKGGALWESGAVKLWQGDLDGDILRVFHIDHGEGADAVYELDGKPISILEAAHFVEEWCREYWSAIGGEQYEYKVKTGYLRQTESGKYRYQFDICLWYQGIPFNDFWIGSEKMLSDDADIKDFYDTNYLVAYMNSTDHLSYFSNRNELHLKTRGYICDPVAHPYEGESLIDLQQALQRLDQKMADGPKRRIDEIGLVYMTALGGGTAIPVWYFATDDEKYDQDGKRIEDQSDWLRREIFMDVSSGNLLVQGSNKNPVY